MEYRYANSAARLAAWREYRAKYPANNPEPLPPNWFGRVSEDTPNREEYESDKRTRRTPTYNYGEGLGGKTRRPFRFVGFADEVVNLRHTGWFGDDEGTGFDVYRGVVFQIPARGGNPQYLAGCEWGENGAWGRFGTGGGWIEIGRGDIYESKEDAARAADSIAERAAESARDERREEEERQRQEEEEAERKRAEEEEEAEERAASTLAGILPLINPVLSGTGYQLGAEGTRLFLTNEEGEPVNLYPDPATSADSE